MNNTWGGVTTVTISDIDVIGALMGTPQRAGSSSAPDAESTDSGESHYVDLESRSLRHPQ